MCENSVVHKRLPPPEYADYASLNEKKARDLEEKQIREADALLRQQRNSKGSPKNATNAKRHEFGNDAIISSAAGGALVVSSTNHDNHLDDDSSLLGGSSLGSLDGGGGEVWDEKVSIFGEAMLDALSGEAADPDSSDLLANQNMANGIISPVKLFGAGMIRVESLYKYLAQRVLQSSMKVREQEAIELSKRLEAEKEAIVEEASELGEAALVKALGKWHKQVCFKTFFITEDTLLLTYPQAIDVYLYMHV
jgi:hypothetical protein